uniref:protein-tyrosine-phosphatase n=1 Tax=Leptobrachium leishanense TaxID=445787 RepID=A0A8C5WKS8_9ANUR
CMRLCQTSALCAPVLMCLPASITALSCCDGAGHTLMHVHELPCCKPSSVLVLRKGCKARSSIRGLNLALLKAHNVTSDSVSLIWDHPDEYKSDYTYRVQTANSSSVTLKNQTTATNQSVVTNLTAGETYIFTVFTQAADNITEKPLPVKQLRSSNVTSDSVSLIWDGPDEYKSDYSYRVQTANSSSVTLKNQTTATNQSVVTNLTAGETYTFTVFTRAADTVTEKRDGSKPLPVKQLRSSNVTSDSVSLIWDHPDEYKSDYSYRVQTANSSSVTLKNQTTATNQSVVTDLTAGETYTFTVFTRAADTVTESEAVSFINCTELLPVKQLRSSNVTSDSVSLIWDHPDEYKSDYSYRVQTANSSSVTLKTQTTATNQSVVTDLTAGETYTFTVFTRAADNVTESEPVLYTTCTEPLPVKQLRSSNVTSDSVSLIWDHPDEYKSDYSYRVQTANSSSVTLKNQTTATNQSVVTNLTAGETYTFTVFTRAADTVTESVSVSHTTCTEPQPVKQLRSSNVTTDSVSLIWDHPDEYKSDYTYRVQTANSSSVTLKNQTTATNQSVVTDLTAGETYTFTVFTRAADNVTESEPESYTTCTEPLPVKQLRSSNVTSDSVSLIWDHPDEYKSDYTYRVQTANSSSVTLKNQTTATNQSVVTNLTAGETYTFTVFTRAADTVTESEAVSFITCTEPLPVKQFRSSDVTSDSVSLIWVHPDDYKSDYTYRVQTANSSSVTLKNQTTATNQSVVTNLTPGETYTFTVFTRAADTVTESVSVSHTTCTVPVNVLTFTCNTVYLNPVLSLEWKCPEGTFNSFNLSVTNVPTEVITSNCVNGNQTFNKTGLAYNTQYSLSLATVSCGKASTVNQIACNTSIGGKSVYDVSRVKLSIINNPNDDYINANYIPGYKNLRAFIAAQGPLPTTVNDFWRMIWEKDVRAVVMLTKCVEVFKVKCEEYWPSSHPKQFNGLNVSQSQEDVLPEWTIRDFEVTNSSTNQSHLVRHFHFTAWPDHDVPQTTDALITFRNIISDFMKNYPRTPILVHCSAGVGRTGTLIALDRAIRQIDAEDQVDVLGIVRNLRMHRNLMVQTESQYIFLNKCVLDYIQSQANPKPDLIHHNANAVYENFKSFRNSHRNNI